MKPKTPIDPRVATPIQPHVAFTLRVSPWLAMKPITVRCWITGYDDRGAYCYVAEVRHEGKTIFPSPAEAGNFSGAALWGAFGLRDSVDGNDAKKHVLCHVAMHPSARGGEGEDFYADYSEVQLAFVERYGEGIDCERAARYCDPETGMARS